MGYYFPDHQSLFSLTGFQVTQTLNAIARRFVGQNPPHPMTYRPYSRSGIRRGPDYRYIADFNQFFPKAKAEQYVYAWSKIWSDAPAAFQADVNCYGPLVIYLNGQIAFKSDIFTERYSDKRHRINLPLQTGWNHILLRAKKTGAGFGGIFGTWLGKHPYYFLMPTPDREGQEGWLFTQPLDHELPTLPGPGMSERDTQLTWLPRADWSPQEKKLGQLQRIFGKTSHAAAVGWSKAFFSQAGNAKYTLKGRHSGPITIFVDDEKVFSAKSSGRINATITVPFGHRDIIVQSTSTGRDWGFDLEISGGKPPLPVPLSSPCNITDPTQPWIYLGPLKSSAIPTLSALRDLTRVHPGISGNVYWQLDLPDTWVRPYNENALYGRWNYPLGVTLYGLLHAARAIGSAETQQYIVRHMQSCCDTLAYALWDRDQYGGATAMHSLLTSIDSLDDCGSFGSAMLEVAQYFDLKGSRHIADYVADYITNKQTRLDDGTFCRKTMMHIFHENTMWADDLYMSVPFLCRYSQLTKDRKYLDDAARQFLGFKKKLFMPQLKVMSHIYDLRRDMPTGVPWGRANGWTIFSLSELLAVLPANHQHRPALLAFFRELCEGYLALQDDAGMWHQVLTHHDSYPETSCTAMFTYAFARGVHYGWLQKPEPYIQSVFKAWEAINKISIDKAGNIYGVCRGSEFSFTPEYYKKELSWNLNDTHGVGIVMLAGVEVIKLTNHLQKG